MSYNFERVGLLLHVADLVRQWPNLNGVQDRVMAELQDISNECKAEMEKKRADDKAKAEAEAAAYAEQKAAEAKAEQPAEQPQPTTEAPATLEATVERRV